MIELAMAMDTVMVTYKALRTLLDKIKDIEIKNLILEMNEQLLSMKESALELKNENMNLKEEINKLIIASDKKLIFRDGGYYDGDTGPYCQTCYDNGKQLVLMSDAPGICSYWCHKCDRVIK